MSHHLNRPMIRAITTSPIKTTSDHSPRSGTLVITITRNRMIMYAGPIHDRGLTRGGFPVGPLSHDRDLEPDEFGRALLRVPGLGQDLFHPVSSHAVDVVPHLLAGLLLDQDRVPGTMVSGRRRSG